MKKIAIHSVPRSGSTWLGQIFDSGPSIVYKFQPLFSYAFKGFLDSDSSRAQILEFFGSIANREDDFLDQIEARREGKIPLFAKSPLREAVVYKEVRYHYILSNLIEKLPEVRIVGLIRNPLAVLNSWHQAPKEFKQGWNFWEEWRDAPSKNLDRREEYNGFNKWCEVAQMFLRLRQQHPEQFFLIRYQDLLTNTQESVRQLFEFCEIPLVDQTSDFLRSSRERDNQDAYSVFKSHVEDSSWRTELPAPIIEEVIERLNGTELETFLGDVARAG